MLRTQRRIMAAASLARLTFWSAIIFTLVMASLPKVPQLPGQPSDKVQHIVAFMVLTALATLAYPKARLTVLGMGLCCFGALIEFIQLIPWLHRDASLADWAVNTGATILILSIARMVPPTATDTGEAADALNKR